jgi:hypothetical protein
MVALNFVQIIQDAFFYGNQCCYFWQCCYTRLQADSTTYLHIPMYVGMSRSVTGSYLHISFDCPHSHRIFVFPVLPTLCFILRWLSPFWRRPTWRNRPGSCRLGSEWLIRFVLLQTQTHKLNFEPVFDLLKMIQPSQNDLTFSKWSNLLKII